MILTKENRCFLESYKCRSLCENFNSGTLDFWWFDYARTNNR